MVDTPKGEGSKYPTLMRQYETDEDLDEYVIDHAHMFVVIQIRPGGYINGYGSNYTRTEVTFEKGDDPREALATAVKIAEDLYEKTKKSLLVYAVADFAGAIGFNRPVRLIPAPTFRSKADQRRDDLRARKLRQEDRARKKLAEDAPVKAKKPKAAVFKTTFEKPKAAKEIGLTDEEFAATDVPLARLIRT
jgi:hypothetical protein